MRYSYYNTRLIRMDPPLLTKKYEDKTDWQQVDVSGLLYCEIPRQQQMLDTTSTDSCSFHSLCCCCCCCNENVNNPDFSECCCFCCYN